MKYTQIPRDVPYELSRLATEPFDEAKAWVHPSYFTYRMLGIMPYRYQHMIMRRFVKGDLRKSNRIIVCKSRQIGISWCVAFLAIWCAITNQAASGPFKDTKVGIISKDDKAAKKLMALIQKLVFESKHNLDILIKGGRRAPLNKSEIHFINGFIKCFPPTRAAAGETFDFLILDEAAFVDDEILIEVLEPTVSAVDGNILLVSTPTGQKGFFYELFDPNDLKDKHEYYRYYLHWKMCENEAQKRLIREKGEHAKRDGNMKSFDQEYNALFTVDTSAFFEDQDVEKGYKEKNISLEYESTEPCSLAIDYGIIKAATTLTIVKETKKGPVLIFQFAQKGLDDNLITDPDWENSVQNLNKRYNLLHVVVDDCAQGNQTNKKLEDEGYPILRFNFKADSAKGERNRGYYIFRSALKNNKIHYPELRNLMGEMKSLQEVKMDLGKYVRIKAPVNYSDDRIDGLMMACYPFLSDEGNDFKSVLVSYQDIADQNKKKRMDGRFDEQWEKLKRAEALHPILQKQRGRPKLVPLEEKK